MATRPDENEGLRARREALGLTLEQVQAATRIPVTHLVAMELGRLQDLPEGPWRHGYLREYRKYLGLEYEQGDEVAEPAVPPPPGGLPLWAVRLVAGGTTLLLVVAVVWQLVGGSLPLSPPTVAASTDVPDQVVKLKALRTGHLKATVDGAVAFDREIAGGEEVEFSGRDRVEVAVSAAERFRIVYNGRGIVPQGRQDEPRRLVFIDDLGGQGGWATSP